jgi:hypothetical protein
MLMRGSDTERKSFPRSQYFSPGESRCRMIEQICSAWYDGKLHNEGTKWRSLTIKRNYNDSLSNAESFAVKAFTFNLFANENETDRHLRNHLQR